MVDGKPVSKAQSSQSGAPPNGAPTAIVIGSGFAGAVTALRLVEAGFDTVILERGRRYDPPNDFPVHPFPEKRPNVPRDTSNHASTAVQPDVSRLTWRRDRGLWDMRDLGDVMVGQAAGFGGGSLIYANVHLRPAVHVFDERWPIKRPELEDYYDLVADKLGASPIPDEYRTLPKCVQLERFADAIPNRDGPQCSYLHGFSPPLAVDFKHCDLQGNCCFGCPKKDAKNTLDTNYLQCAERKNAKVITGAEVIWIKQTKKPKTRKTRKKGKKKGKKKGEKRRLPEFEVVYRDLSPGSIDKEKTLAANYVFVCAGAINTTELLMRCKEDGRLSIEGAGLGKCFHPNQDTVGVVFDCDDPQELDRGPTITSSLLYDRLPGEREADARWRLRFSGAPREPNVGQILRCKASDGSSWAVVASPAYLLSGTYGGTAGALGEVVVRALTPAESNEMERGSSNSYRGPEFFSVDGELSVFSLTPKGAIPEASHHSGTQFRVAAKVRPLRQWLLFQDGGLSSELASTAGLFRSPLWLRRNGFVEPPGPFAGGNDLEQKHDRKNAAMSQKPAFAELPLEALTDVVSSLTRETLSAGSQLSAITDYSLQLLREPAPTGREDSSLLPSSDESGGDYHLIPKQLRRSLTDLRARVIDDIGLGAEEIVAEFLDSAASTMAPQIEKMLKSMDSDTVASVTANDPDLSTEVIKMALRLGVQLLWGSQGGLARAVADHAASMALPSRDNLVKLAVRAAERILDYRLPNGHTAVILSMGLDSMPGTLGLDLPSELKVGDILHGETSGQTAIVIGRSTASREGEQDLAEGSQEATVEDLKVAGPRGAFIPEERIFVGNKVVGALMASQLLPNRNLPSEESEGIEIWSIRVAGDVGNGKSEVIRAAPFRAKLPASVDTPERGVAERIARDMASAWGGELRTDPQWTFLRKRITVHPQGGCPMRCEAPKEATGEQGQTSALGSFGVTDRDGNVIGCPGLYVMDAAAFPGPVGANPSATIAALAEYKIERFLEAQPKTTKIREALDALARARAEAKARINAEGRGRLDPLGPSGRVPAQGTSATPFHRPVGIEFKERMTGSTYSESETARSVVTDLTVRIDDLAGFLASHSRDSRARIPIAKGKLELDGVPDGLELDTERSYMQVMVDDTRDEARQQRKIIYELATKNGKYRLRGTKYVQDDPGPDLLDDTTTLGFELLEEGKTHTGTLTLGVDELFGSQIPGFEVTTDDPARQAWAMASFVRFFFGNLVDVYVPPLRPFTELLSNLTRRGHG